MNKTSRLVLLATLVVLTAAPASVHAVILGILDLDSLIYASTAVVEGEVVAAEESQAGSASKNRLTVRVTKVVAGDIKADEKITVVIGDNYRKNASPTRYVTQTRDFAVGDTLILFLARMEKQQRDYFRADYWPVTSGVKVVEDGEVTGMAQWINPGPYVNVIAEGKLDAYREKMAASQKWVATFKKDLAEKKKDPAWLLATLAARPVQKDMAFQVDVIALDLCKAIAATRDPDAIARAKALRKNSNERWALDQ